MNKVLEFIKADLEKMDVNNVIDQFQNYTLFTILFIGLGWLSHLPK